MKDGTITTAEVPVETQKCVQRLFKQHGLDHPHCISFAQKAPTIGCGGTSVTLRAESGNQTFFVKFADGSKLSERTEYHNQLQESNLLPVPQMVACGEGYQIQQWIENDLLFELVKRDDSCSLDCFKRALKHLQKFWGKTLEREKKLSGNHKKSVDAQKKLRDFLGDIADLPVVVKAKENGKELELISEYSVSTMFNNIVNQLAIPFSFSCKTHGDARTDNIIVSEEEDIFFIDGRPGFPIMLDDLALMAWQRGFRFVEFSETSLMSKKNERLEVSYNVKWSSFEDEAERVGLSVGEEFFDSLDKGIQWRTLYHSIVAALALREIVSIQRRKKLNDTGCQVPQNGEGFWIAEAIRHHEIIKWV